MDREQRTIKEVGVTDRVTADDVRRWAQIVGIKLAGSDEVVMKLAEFAIFARAALTPPAKVNVGLHPAIREGVEAAFDGRDGWMTKIAAAARHLPTEDAKVGGDEREALPASVHEALAFYADSTVDYITFDKTRRQAQLDARRNSPDWEEIGEDGRGHERFVVTGNKASTALEDLERWEESRTALSADGGEESPSLTNPLTPYGMLVRALRIVADTTLMEMSQRCGMTPSYLSALEFGRKAVTNDDATSAAVFFASKGIAGTLGLLQAAIAANQAKGDAS